jgi:hypothetical protein
MKNTIAGAENFTAWTWEAAAQEAAFDGLCFCMLADGRFVNHSAMPPGTPHKHPLSLSNAFLQRYLKSDFAKS